MATNRAKKKAEPAEGGETADNLQAAWPFPTTRKAEPGPVEQEAVDPIVKREDFRADFDAHADATNPPADRIRVEAIDLYTDPAKNQVERIALEQLLESPFNPRTRFDDKALQELAETVRGVGVMQPLLVRPVTMPDGWSITRAGETMPAYEIVFGHRRFRAGRLAGVADVPVIVRDLTDAQAAQLQAIENVQREQLDPIEEARGYAHYLKVHGVNKDQLAKEVGLSRTHVYSRLKLLEAVPAVHEALRKGEIYEENALAIARIPHAKLQEKAIASLNSNHLDLEDGGKRSVRRIKDFLRERFTLKLSGAIFKIDDAALAPLAGPCTTCAKRSGNAPEFADLAADTQKDWAKELRAGPDLCTDPDCFDAKKKAHLRAQADKLRTHGKTVVDGGKARSAIGVDGRVKGAYIALKDVKALLAASKKKDLPKASELAVVTIQNPRDGKTVEAVKVEDLPASVKPKQPTGARSSNSAADDKRVAENERIAKQRVLDCRVNKAVLVEVRHAAAGRPLTALALRLAVFVAFAGVDWNDRNLLAELHGFKNEDQLGDAIEKLPPDRLATLLLDCALIQNVDSGYEKPEPLLAMAKELGVNVAEIRKRVEKAPPDTETQDLLKSAEQADEEEAEEA